MAQSLADIVIHIVFSAKERKPWIDAVNESELHAYICGICRNLDCLVIKINGVEDHVHVLLCQTQNLTAWAMRYWPFRPFKRIGLCRSDL